LLVAATVASALVWSRLPESMPTHFDLSGTPNGFMPRAWGASFGPVVGLCIWAFVHVVGRFSPAAKAKVPAGAIAFVAFLTAALMVAIHLVILHAALAPTAYVMRPLWMILGAFIFVLGLIMPRLRQNGVAGIRTAWTLGSQEVWARTHRLAGYTMAVGGMVTFVAGVVGGSAAGAVALVAMVVSSVVPAVYSFVLARSLAGR
jgi:uncharacterized membrane protein